MVKKDTKAEKKDPEEVVLEIIEYFGFVRRNTLYQMLKRGVTSKKELPPETSETSYSQPFIINGEDYSYTKEIDTKPIELSLVTFNRILKRLVHLKVLKNLKYPLYEKLGIHDNDKKASYITSYQIFEMIQHYDSVLEQVKDKSPIKRKNALIEIESMMNGVIFTPEQLMKLSNFLAKMEESLNENSGDNIIRILYHSIINKRLFPSDLEKFQEDLIEFYKKNSKKISANIKSALLSILGLLNNKVVIEFLYIVLGNSFFSEVILRVGLRTWTCPGRMWSTTCKASSMAKWPSGGTSSGAGITLL